MAHPISIRNRTKLLVGIDYGTTFSGISFVLSNASDFKDIKPWTAWPGGPSENNDHLQKAPSRYAYAFENDDLTSDVWGYEVEAGMTSCLWTKLLLDQSAVSTEYDDPNLMKAAANGLMRLPRGKTAKDVVTDYMKGLHAMFVKAVSAVWGDDLSFPIEFWLTVPATWSDQAKWATRAAAMDAGFGARLGDEINLIPEPEAAAHLALKSSIHHVDDLVKQNTGVLVCDCGGGTVDITTYVVEQVSPILKLEEACVGVGGKCGGTYIDRNLYELLERRFGKAFTSLPPDRNGPGSPFMQQFESKKKSFSTVSSSRRPTKLHLIMPELNQWTQISGYDSRYSDILLTHDDMKSCFDPVVESILDLTNDQVNAVKRKGKPAIETVILIGGLGSSPYIREKIQKWCTEKDIRLTTPWGGGWSAVVCGAVLRGLEGSLVDKKSCRRYYGHSMCKKYNPLTDWNYNANTRYRWNDPFTGEEMLTGYMFWEISKGDVIDSTTEIHADFVIYFTEGGSMTLDHALYACSLNSAPETIENERVEKVGNIKGSFADIDLNKHEFRVKKNGKKVYRIEFALTIQLGAKDGTLQCKLLMRGREIGQTWIDFSYL